MSDNCCSIDMRLSESDILPLRLGDSYHGPYQLPTMSASVKGGAKVGDGLEVVDDVLSIADGGVTAEMLASGAFANLPTMTAEAKGGAKLGSGLEVTSSVLSLDLVDSATGTSITADDASYLEGLTIEGKAVQNGTPTPSAPVEIQVVQGINLLNGTVVIDDNGTTFTENSDGTITANGASSGGSSQYKIDFVADFEGDYTFSGCPEGGSAINSYDVYMWDMDAGARPKKWNGTSGSTSDIGNGAEVKINKGTRYRFICRISSGYTANNVTFKPMLAEGSYAAPYIPYGSLGLKVNSTITPIDLQGNVLASLPDGTKDELTVDSSGHVELVKRVSVKTLNGTESWMAYASWNSADQYCYYTKINDYYGQALVNLPVCSFATAYSHTDFATNKPNDACGFDSSKNFCVRVPYSAKTDFTTWLSSNNQYFYYRPATPQTIDLGYIDMPTIADGTSISITAQVTPTITASWWARGAAAIATAIKALRDDLLARIEAIETAIADL